MRLQCAISTISKAPTAHHGRDRVPYQEDIFIKDWPTGRGETVQYHWDDEGTDRAGSWYDSEIFRLEDKRVPESAVWVCVLQVFEREEDPTGLEHDWQAHLARSQLKLYHLWHFLDWRHGRGVQWYFQWPDYQVDLVLLRLGQIAQRFYWGQLAVPGLECPLFMGI